MQLVGAADASGNGDHVAILVGEQAAAKRCREGLGSGSVHMRRLQGRKLKEARANLLDAPSDVFLLCMRVNRSVMLAKMAARSPRKNKESLRRDLDYAIRRKMHEFLDDFLGARGGRLEDIEFEVDADLEKSFRIAGLKTKSRGTLHEIVDVVGWANSASYRIRCVLDKDVTKDIESVVMR
ncbi:MAG: hypothetical protein JRN52_12175 [Nitrososphaerota archaeon]|nr:hypothetical protein [Nitrososphaerota archaeon]